MPLVLRPDPRLRPYIACLWAGERPAEAAPGPVLPGGGMHLAVRVAGGPVRVYDDAASGRLAATGEALVAGARVAPYWKDAGVATRTVGAQLRPGAAQALFGVSAAELAGRHVPLEALWRGACLPLREALLDAPGAAAQLVRLQAALLACLRASPALHPSVAQALARIHADPAATRLPDVAGISQRHFIARFRDATGLAPKRYARLRRFRALLRALSRDRHGSLATLALAAGYGDQSHCHRDFVEFAGMPPHAWRRAHARPARADG